jgi:hypothetical protein
VAGYEKQGMDLDSGREPGGVARARQTWNPFFFSTNFSIFSARVYKENRWVSHIIFLMKVMLLNGITKR